MSLTGLISWVPKVFSHFNKNGYLKTETFEHRHAEVLRGINDIASKLELHTAQDSQAVSDVHRRVDTLKTEMHELNNQQTDRLIKVIMENSRK